MNKSIIRLVCGLLLAVGMASRPAVATELNIWVMATAQQQPDMKELMRPYLIRHPDLRVNVTVLNWESAWNKITAAAASGRGPDILELGTTWVSSISSMNALEPISTQQQNEVGSAKAFIPAVWSTTHRYDDNKVYAIPWYADARAAYYRTDVFKKAGINPKEAFSNWGSFKQAMQKINGQVIDGKKIYALGYPGKNDLNIVHNLAPWIWNAGGDFLTADKKHSAINSPEALHAITYYSSFAVEGMMPLSALEKDSSQIEAGFFNGQYAVIFSGSWVLKQLTKPKTKGGQMESVAAHNFGVEAYPAGLKGNQTLFAGSDLAIMKSSKNKDEAWKLLAYLTSHDAEIAYSKMSAMLPARLDAIYDPSLMADQHYAAFVAQVKNGRHYPSIAGWGPLESVYLKNIGNMFDIVAGVKDKYSPQAIKHVLDATAREADEVLQGSSSGYITREH